MFNFCLIISHFVFTLECLVEHLKQCISEDRNLKLIFLFRDNIKYNNNNNNNNNNNGNNDDDNNNNNNNNNKTRQIFQLSSPNNLNFLTEDSPTEK